MEVTVTQAPIKELNVTVPRKISVGMNLEKHDTRCQKCGSEIRQAIGVCPRCILTQAVESIAASDHPALGAMAVSGRCPSIDSLNEQFPDFEFHELLGRGGSGWTFRATQKSLSRSVAIKLISRTTSHAEALERFQREAGILAKLNHPSIVTVHDFGIQDQFLYIVMEFVPGTTLRRLIAPGKLKSERVIGIGKQICDALDYAHAKGLVHRDIKPENILVVSSEPEVEIRLADFGISRMALERDSMGGLTRTGLIIGTPFYMAPEQQVPGKSIDRRTDIFSVGVVLYELLTGQLPQGNFPPPSKLSDCNGALDKIVMKALNNDPNLRFESAASLKQSLISIPGSKQGFPSWKSLAAILALLASTVLLVLIFSTFLADNDSTKIPEEDSQSMRLSKKSKVTTFSLETKMGNSLKFCSVN